MEMPHIVYGVDRTFLGPLLVSMWSLLKTRCGKTRVTVFTTDTGVAEAPEMRQLASLFDDAEIAVRPVDNEALQEYERANETRFTAASLIPLFIPQLVSGNRCLYLDADTVVVDDIARIYDADLNGNLVGACKDIGMDREFRRYLNFTYRNILYPSRARRRKSDCLWRIKTFGNLGEGYVNAGVILYDLKAIRDFDRAAKLADARSSLQYSMRDQDIFNLTFKGRIHCFNLRWKRLQDVLGPHVGSERAACGGSKGRSPAPRHPALHGLLQGTAVAAFPMERYCRDETAVLPDVQGNRHGNGTGWGQCAESA